MQISENIVLTFQRLCSAQFDNEIYVMLARLFTLWFMVIFIV